MKTSTLETLIWVLIYGGLLVLSLSVFVGRESVVLGSTLGTAGVVAAAVGVVLIVVRSRMKTPKETN
jgi:hypothetical protein